MQSYLILGKSPEKRTLEAEKLSKKLGAAIIHFTLAKIENVRKLSSITKLATTKKTAIIISDVDKATHPALNAFLKNLEEPNKNVFYILTADNDYQLLPTIVSRCQIIKTTGSKISGSDSRLLVEKFMECNLTEKLLFIDTIRERESAKEFVQELILKMHKNFLKGSDKRETWTKSLGEAQNSLRNLEANGNVALQLTNLTIKLAPEGEIRV